MRRHGVRSEAVRRLLSPLATALLALLLAAPGAAALQDRPAPSPLAPTPAAVASPDQVIVQWAPGAGRSDKAEARAEAEVSLVANLGDPGFQLVTVRPGQSAGDAVAELRDSAAVAVAERDRYIATDAVPDDPLFDQLWGLRNQGLGIGGVTGGVAGADIDAVAAWDRTVGDPAIVVADIDSGYRFEHPDLANVAWDNPDEADNGIDDDGNGIVDDLHGADFVGANGNSPSKDGDPTDDDLISGGHGVHTAGTIGAEGDNGIGIAGVAQDIRIMPLRVCTRFPSLAASRCSIAAIVAAINYAGAKGARVANMSLGGAEPLPQTEVNALAANPGVLFVVSAGNDGEDNDAEPHYPCNFQPQLDASPPVPGAIDNVVCVAATDQADGLAGFSDWGATAVDLGAPGTEVLSTYPFTTPFAEDFEVDDFSTQWPATGADGGFERTDEAPLTSFGMTDAAGAPLADTVRETTSAAFAVPPNGGCRLTQMRRVILGGTAAFRYSVLLDGVELAEANPGSTAAPGLERRFLDLPSDFEAGGSVQIRFRFTAGAAPSTEAGVWLDDLSLVCAQAVGQASAYAFLQGTSMAAPHVSGAAALLFSLRPAATVTQARNALLESVDPVPSLAGKTVSGGRLDADAALARLTTPPAAPLLTATDPPSPANRNDPRILGSAPAGASIRIFAGETCAGSPLAAGSAAELESPGIAVAVLDDSISQFSATATNSYSSTSACSAPISYVEQSEPPPPPSLSGTDPASPADENQPRIVGSAATGTAVKIYAGGACAGGTVASGSAAELESPGIAVTVTGDSVSQFSATASDAVNTSACSAPISYTEETPPPPDLTPPAAPVLTTMSPPSPSASTTPRIVGEAEPGSAVDVYLGADCEGSPLTGGSAAGLKSPGILVNVSPNSIVTYSADATDAATNASACSAPISNVNVTPFVPIDEGGDVPPPIDVPPDRKTPNPFELPPPIPTCTVPKLSGKTLARAKTALAGAPCPLGKVTKPKARKGRRLPSLIVKSSSPAAGAVTAGPVNLTLGPKPKVKKPQR